MWGGDFPHTPLNNARAISWGSCDSAQFSCCLPGKEIRFHRLRAQSHPTSLQPTGQSQVLSSTSAHVLGRFSRVGLFATLYTAAHQAPPSVRFSRQEYFTTSTTWEALRYCSPTGYKSSCCVSSLDFWLLPRLPVYYKGCKATARWRDTQGKIPNTGASVLLLGPNWGDMEAVWCPSLEILWSFMGIHLIGMIHEITDHQWWI